MANSYTWLDRVQESINLLQTFSRNNFRTTPTSEQQVTLYVEWFVKVESIIGELLKAVGIVVDSGVDPVTGLHRYHENMLESLRNPCNPYHSILGKGEVQDVLTEAKEIRNSVIGKSSRPRHRVLPDWRRWRGFVNQVERTLLIATSIMACEKAHIENDKKGLLEEEIGQEVQSKSTDKKLNTAVLEADAMVKYLPTAGDKEPLSRQEKNLQEKDSDQKMQYGDNDKKLEPTTQKTPAVEALHESYMQDMAELEALHKRFQQERAAKLKAEAVQAANKARSEAAKQRELEDRIRDLYVAEKQLKEDRSSLESDREAHKADVTAFDQKVAKEQAKVEREREREMPCRIPNHAILQKENDELRQQLSQRVPQAKSNFQYRTLCGLIIHHQNARSSDPTSSTAMGNTGMVEENLPALVTGLMASHIHSEKKAEAAKNRGEVLQREVEDLRYHLATVEAMQESQHGKVMSLLSSMEYCNNPAHHMLKTLIDE